jgi:hypothetical protein
VWRTYQVKTKERLLTQAALVSGKKVVYRVKPTCGIADRDIMLQLYNDVGMYPGVRIPSPEVAELGVKLHTAEDYIRERLLPHLGLQAIGS